MALGAERREVLGLVLRDSMALIAAGLIIGLLGAAAVTRYLDQLLFGLTPLDRATFVWVAVAMLAATLLASYIPARRATSVDPLIALRTE